MDTLITWLIVALLYAPLHLLVPMLVVFLAAGDSAAEQRRRLIAAAIDCALSIALAMTVLLLSTPCLRIAMHR